MAELTSEERRRIYLEEKPRAEAAEKALEVRRTRGQGQRRVLERRRPPRRTLASLGRC